MPTGDTTEIGDVLEVVEDLERGWLWCRAASGEEGWIPIETVARMGSSGAPDHRRGHRERSIWIAKRSRDNL
jgi:hypothetical protein